MVPDTFEALLIDRDADGRARGRLQSVSAAQLDPGEVTIRVRWSSINYKDALAATGAGKIIRRFPCIGGIDLAGEVIASSDARFAAGDEVLATSFDLGVSHHGGYARYARVPAGWVLHRPAGLTPFETMALGTAGFTAALAIQRMEHNGLVPGAGPVVVSGASGGVGGLAIDMLARRGYEVVALTGKADQADHLLSLGAADVLLTSTIDHSKVRALETGRWAGAVDNVGGPILGWLLATMKQAGTVASIGNAASAELHTTVYPFILRGACLLGVDSGYIGFPLRRQLWERLAGDLKPAHLQRVTHTIGLSALPAAFDDFIQGRARGRTVVAIDG